MSVERVEVLERADSRWRVRVVLGASAPLRGFTVGFVGEDGVPLGPAVVAPEGEERDRILEVRGPCTLPPGTVARVVIYVDGVAAETCEVVVARRRGLHAWLNADDRLPLVSRAQPEPLSGAQRRRLAERWCWFSTEADAPAGTCGADLPDEMKAMLREFGVNADEMSDELAAALRSR